MGKKGKKEEREITAPKRLERELEYMKEYPYTLPAFRELKVDPTYPLRWTALLLPDSEPYNDGAYRIEIVFPKDYPFKPPRVLFLTKIYHPNVNSRGEICLAMLAGEHWKPTTRIHQIIETLVALLNTPDPDDPILPELGEEYLHDPEKFKGLAMHAVRKFAEPRPGELPPPPKKKFGVGKKK